MKPEEFNCRLAELLRECQGGWEKDLEEQPILRGFYVCADYGDFEGRSVFFASSGDGNGDDRISPWAIRGYLHYALDRDMLGFKPNDELDEE